MKASEIITRLQEIVKRHGDLICVAHDGMDPSDLEEVKEVLVKSDTLNFAKSLEKEHQYIVMSS